MPSVRPLPSGPSCHATRSQPLSTSPVVARSALAPYHAPGCTPFRVCSAQTVPALSVCRTSDGPAPGIHVSVHARPCTTFQPASPVSNVPFASASARGAGVGVALGRRMGLLRAIGVAAGGTGGASSPTVIGSGGGGGGGGGMTSVMTRSSTEKRAPAAVAAPVMTTSACSVPAGAVTEVVVIVT